MIVDQKKGRNKEGWSQPAIGIGKNGRIGGKKKEQGNKEEDCHRSWPQPGLRSYGEFARIEITHIEVRKAEMKRKKKTPPIGGQFCPPLYDDWSFIFVGIIVIDVPI